MANLRTGDIKRFENEPHVFTPNDNWAVVGDYGVMGFESRSSARNSKDNGERIAKIIKRTPKYVTVEITK